ncbi:MAG: ATP-binding domain-containing protein [Phocaeicola sp.]
MNTETIEDIANSIDSHIKAEISAYLPNRAFARAYCTCNSTNGGNMEEVFWLVNRPNTRGMHIGRDFTGSGSYAASSSKTTLENDGQSVYKNTKMGEVLTKAYKGTHSYETTTNIKRINRVDITIHNRTVYTPISGGARDIEIRMSGDTNYYKFHKLSSLLKAKNEDQENLQKQKEALDLLKKEQERLAAEIQATEKAAAEKAKEDEFKRIELLRIQREKEEVERRAEIERLERSISDTKEKIKSVKSFLRTSAFLRSQHLLDPYQEDAKRSHIYDGIPIVIEGGPGTGKTTTMIQRLKFMLSKEALNYEEDGYKNPLTLEQLDFLTDPSSITSRWLFFSPTELLLHYLRKNMIDEGLIADDKNTRTIPPFRKMIMREYSLFDPSKDGPFKDYKPSNGEDKLIISASQVIDQFENFCINHSTKSIYQRVAMQTSQYEWHQVALDIKSICSRFKNITDIDTLIRLFNSLHDNEKKKVKVIEDELKDILKTEGVKVKQAILKNDEITSAINHLFDKWRKERIQTVEEDDLVDIDEEEEEELATFSKQEFEAQLFSQVKQLLKQVALRKIDSQKKLSKRYQELYAIIENVIGEDIALNVIGEKAWFVSNFAILCRGVESNLIKKIPAMYKAFRKSILITREKEGVKTESGLIMKATGFFNDDLLEKIMKKDSNKHLHPDEQNLIIGFINNMLYGINKKSKSRFEELKHKYAKAYKQNVKPVIGIDEATDYSLLEYYFMVSFRHNDFCSITLCGDIMQGLNNNGIQRWNELKNFILPKLEVMTLDVSYRQLPTLLDMAREMYKDDQNVYPSYHSDKEKTADEPKPLLFISEDEDEKAEWISQRILDINESYEDLPSIAIFVGDEVDIAEFIERITDLDLLNGIDIVDCSGNKTLQNKEMIRVFRLSEVKGMEFEAVFFYDIDKAITNHSAELMRRFLYVGVSRATSHLAATLCSEDKEGIIKYFDTETEGW